MRAVSFSRTNVGQLEVVEKPYPKAKEGEVTIRIKAAGLNHRELSALNFGKYEHIDTFIFGSDGAGVIEEVGDGVRGLKVGDEVLFSSVLNQKLLGTPSYEGTLAEYIGVSAKIVAKKPEKMSFEEAAAIPLGFGTAWQIIKAGGVKEGDTVLIHGIGGGVALFSLQIAVALKAKAIVTSSNDEKLDRAKSMGAFAGINYRIEDITKLVKSLTNEKGADVVFDGIGTSTIQTSIDSVRQRGKVISYGLVTGRELSIDAPSLFMKEISLIGADVIFSENEFKNMIEFIKDHKIVPTVSNVYKLEEINDAYKTLKEARQFGKIVVTI